ncbi:hypothetical protein BEH94_10255 [Candidatus Altiarchaeales archaeon WOR_SM1_SCG]|nr:hypothetical protein BEH94_10255 [Candidatus Altiarchaeales archaeon WOR_SM1_SCG]
MVYKTISISGEVYSKLLALKRSNESFSDLFLRVTKKEKPKLRNFYGKWKMSDKEEESILKDINSLWSSWEMD